MGMDQFVKALSMLPQISASIKKMTEEEKRNFVQQLGLEGEEKETAYNIITCFQEGKKLEPGQQKIALQLFEKAMQMNQLDLNVLFGFNSKKE